jgi:hypothetical protein
LIGDLSDSTLDVFFGVKNLAQVLGHIIKLHTATVIALADCS